MMNTEVRVLTNLQRFPTQWTVVGLASGSAVVKTSLGDIFRALRGCDLIIINGDVRIVLALCLYFAVAKRSRRPIVAVDLVLTAPQTAGQKFTSWMKRLLLRRVDHFINYFKTSEGYQRCYGIGPDRSSFVHFKPNIRGRFELTATADGEYILCFGRSRRDYDTFIRAVSSLPYPAAIPRPDIAALQKHGSRFTYDVHNLPKHLRLLDDDGSDQAMIRIISGAKLVVLPMLASNLLAGVGIYLNAMLLKKCVIITAGSGVSDVLTDEALFVPPEDEQALAAMIREAWQNENLRRSTAEKGYAHALSLGGEQELFSRVLETTLRWYARH